MNINEKLMKIQQSLNAPKDQFNAFGKYNYRSAESILQSVKPLLSETKTVLRLTDSVVEVGGRVYIKATATLADTESGEWTFVDAFAREEDSKKGMDSSQVTGAASSYARKYALNGLFAIDDNKDSDATNTGDTKWEPKPEPKPEPKKAPQQKEDGYYYCTDCGGIIGNITAKDGHTMFPKEVAEFTMKRFGKQLCEACSKKQKK